MQDTAHPPAPAKHRWQFLAALSHRNFRLFWSGQAISLIGTWMQNVSQAWLVLEITNSSFLLGLVSSLQFAPVLLFSLVAGVVADHFPKRRILLFTQASMMMLAFILALLTYTRVVQYWHILLLALSVGLVQTLDAPARQAFFIELVGPQDLMNAIALNSTIFNIARILGPAVAGVVMARFGAEFCFLANGLSFLAVLASLLLIRVPPLKASQVDRNLIGNIQAGLQYVRRTPVVLTAIVLMGILSTFAMNFNILVPVLAKNVLHQQQQGYGFLMSSMGIGALTGALLLAGFSKAGPRRVVLLAGGFGLGLFQVLLGLANGYLMAAALLALAGMSMISFSASTNTTIQVNTPDEYRGRVMSLYSLVFGGVTPFGALFAGGLASLAGARVALICGGGIGVLATAVVIAHRHTWFRTESVPVAREEATIPSAAGEMAGEIVGGERQ
ncbi:MAG: MFS transporter [Firmicutes bacterium]|nr:MFS transporter [Bacillota bacterium]